MPLIARAPMRISFGGGGTDLEDYYSRYGGIVVSAAIDKYFYTVVSGSGSPGLQLISANYGSFHVQDAVEDLVWDGNLALPKAAVDQFGLPPGHEVFMASEVPPGTGLGSSSAAAVCLALALFARQGRRSSPAQLAEAASRLEIDTLGMPIGRQDQYASAFGGINAISFGSSGITVEPLAISPERVKELEDSLMLFFMGSSRRSSTILREQRESTRRRDKRVLESLHAIKDLALLMREEIEKGDLSSIGTLMDRAWQMKKRLADSVTNDFIDRCYLAAREAGALGGKVTGAGGGGFLLLFCPPPLQPRVAASLRGLGLQQMRFRFDFLGAHILMDSDEPGQGKEPVELPAWVLERRQ